MDNIRRGKIVACGIEFKLQIDPIYMQRLNNINYIDAIIILLGIIRPTSEIVYIMLIDIIKSIIFKIIEFRK